MMMRQSKTMYGILAVMMVVGIIGTVAVLESVAAMSLFAGAVIVLICGAVLLYSLMKLEVMDFQEGSYWAKVNQRVNTPKQYTAAQHTYRNMPHTGKRDVALAKGI